MILDLVENVEKFLKRSLLFKGPLLLGFSGGSDSLALLHILLTLRAKLDLKIHLAHVDHGWRPESAAEAEMLRQKAKEWDVPFHSKRLNPEEYKGNLEAASRKERLQFFADIYHQECCHALLLAHHANDQMETVLKRVFEGLSLPYLSGMSEEKPMMGMRVWRPFLKVPKDEINAYLDAFNLKPLDDKTNYDPKFLRARMRSQLIPGLSKSFGKEILPGLNRIASEAQELKHFLDNHLNTYLQKIELNSHGTFLDLSQGCPNSQFEIKYLLRRMAEIKNCSLPYSNVEQAAQLVQNQSADKKIASKVPLIEIDRGRVFLFSQPFPDLQFNFEEGAYPQITTNWKDAWNGRCSVFLPKGDYRLGAPVLKARFLNGPSLGKWWTDNKVPAFLRGLVPVVYSGETVVHEFLTGKLQAPRTNLGIRISSLPIYQKEVHFTQKIAVEGE